MSADELKALGVDPLAIVAGTDLVEHEGENGSFAERPPAAKEKAAIPELTADGEEVSDVQSVVDHYTRYPSTCVVSTPETKVFELPDQLEAWNALQAKGILAGTKSGNLLINHSVNFHNGKYYILATVTTVRFHHLI